MYSTHIEGKFVVAERFIRTLKKKITNLLIQYQKLYIDKLDDTVNECSNTDHSKIKMKSANIQSRTYIDFNVRSNHKDPKIKNVEHLRISKYRNIFEEACTAHSTEEEYTYVLDICNGRPLWRRKLCKRKIKQSLDDKLYGK